KNAPDDFCAAAWLCTGVNGGQFRGNAAIKGGFRAPNSPDNGERAHSKLRTREALAGCRDTVLMRHCAPLKGGNDNILVIN
ncbi:hypothetical protein DBZ53_01715, partial [Salmonella enterica subsp. enterica serovar Stanley]